jgi:hypothetical protein
MKKRNIFVFIFVLIFLSSVFYLFLKEDNFILNSIPSLYNESAEILEVSSQTILLSENFSSDLQLWFQTISPTLENGTLSARNFIIYTSEDFPSKNGIKLSFDISSSNSPSGKFNIKFVEKSYPSNHVEFVTDTTGNWMYWIEGNCITPTPKVEIKENPADTIFHKITFISHSNGSAEWLLDGELQIRRENFDLGGNYNLVLSGSSLIGSKENNIFIDNFEIISLNEVASSSDICKEISHTPSKNSCPLGYCSSNGICCPSYAQYYCEEYCYSTNVLATSKSQGRCTEWKIVC